MADPDARRRRWTVNGPFGEGREVFPVAPDARHLGTAYAAVHGGW
jgi:hypothetical protein